MQLYLPAGHKIGKPATLFAKIEQDRLDELKKRYAGANQSDNATSSSPAKNLQSVADAEAAVAKQGDKVRSLKAAKAEKAVVQQEVNILLALKKELEALIANQNSQTSSPANSGKSVADVEAAVAKQGDKVRSLKAAKAEKAVVQQEVNILLALKKELEAVKANQNSQPAPSSNNLHNVADAEAAVAKQGDKVRSLKAAKTEKAIVQQEVNILLALKKDLERLKSA